MGHDLPADRGGQAGVESAALAAGLHVPQILQVDHRGVRGAGALGHEAGGGLGQLLVQFRP
ncbi:hypothetical protein ABZY09_15670, partial [Streptomyces sp. NPDC002928]|uniref:hypothetical protein n=1 Tax=Streptomyces sp. NPDC002928 TaxID=3154440 RepID=UPI0033A38B6E